MNFTPAIYAHAAALIDRTPWDVSRDAELLYQAHLTAWRRYAHTPIAVGIDIYNLEAEAYGAKIERPAGNGIPAVKEHCCATLDDILALEPFDPVRSGRIDMVISVARRLAETLSDADVRVPLSGPFSIAVSLMGFEGLLMACALEPDKTRAALEHLVVGQEDFCRAVAKAGLDIAMFESAATPPLLAPEGFRTIELPAIKRLMASCAAMLGHQVTCIIGGNTQPILQAILETNPGYVICPFETDQRAFMAEIARRREIMVRVNMHPGIIAGGSEAEILAEVDRAAALARDRENVCLGTGALPYETPPENVDMIADYAAHI
ncbi:MAG: hypothetical protein J7M14_06955 [Planctomycetes bacterium]|nr:hypothetical protein [Planctomycetota bacterium]